MTTPEPTRAELEAAVEAARWAVVNATTEWGKAVSHDTVRYDPDSPYRLADTRARFQDALTAYGAACQALGEHIGREKACGHGCETCFNERVKAEFEARHSQQAGG